MQAYLLYDGELSTKRQSELRELLSGYFAGRGFSLTERALQRDELAFCRGCFECWVKTPANAPCGTALPRSITPV